jgi:hypothetical protein
VCVVVNEEALAHWGAVVPKTNKLTTEQRARTERLRRYDHLAHRICRVLSCKPRGKRSVCVPLKRWHEIVICHGMMVVMRFPP